MRKLAVISLAALALSLAATSGAQAVDRLPIVQVSPPSATSLYPGSLTRRHPRCMSCDRPPPVDRYPSGDVPPAQKADEKKADSQDTHPPKPDDVPPPPRVPPGK